MANVRRDTRTCTGLLGRICRITVRKKLEPGRLSWLAILATETGTGPANSQQAWMDLPH